jgi:DNA-binding CsgD family transcriptional regulator
MTAKLVLGTHCTDCGREMIPASLWSRLPATARQALADTHARRHARGICTRCTTRRIKDGTLIDAERVRLTHEEIIEEYQILGPLGEGHKLSVIADRLGIHLNTLKAHLTRERRR